MRGELINLCRHLLGGESLFLSNSTLAQTGQTEKLNFGRKFGNVQQCAETTEYFRKYSFWTNQTKLA